MKSLQFTTSSKKIILSIITILILCSVFLGMIPQCHAKTQQEYKQELINKGQGAGEFLGMVYDIACISAGCHPDYSLKALAGSLYKFANFQGDLSDQVKQLTGVSVGEQTLLSAAQKMYEALKVAGIALIMLYFLIEILDEVQADNFNMEHLIKKLITLAIAILVMQQGDKIFRLIAELGDALIDDVNAAVSGGDKGVEELYNQFSKAVADNSLFSVIKVFLFALGILLEKLPMYLLMLVAWLVAYLTSYSRMIEFLVRFTMAPIGIAQLVSGGAKGPGMRYVKKFASCCLQGAICTLAFGVADIIQQNSNALAGSIGQFILPITLIGFLMRAKQIADDVVGV